MALLILQQKHLSFKLKLDLPLVDGIMALEFERTPDGASDETSNMRAPIKLRGTINCTLLYLISFD